MCRRTYRQTNPLRLISEAEYARRYDQDQPLMTLKIASKQDIPKTRQIINDFLQTCGCWQPTTRKKILAALSEAVTNVVKYASQGEILVYQKEQELRLHVVDKGPGLLRVCSPYLLFAKGYSQTDSLGMGLYLLLHYCDQVVLCTTNQGTKLVLYFCDCEEKGR